MKTIFYVLTFLSVFRLVCSCQEEVVAGDNELLHTWEATGFMSLESVAYPKNDNYSPRLTFKRDGKYSLKLDMNSCMGSFEKGEGNSLSIQSAGCTKICCDSQFSEKLAGMLSRVTSYTIEKNTMQLHVPGWGYIECKRVE